MNFEDFKDNIQNNIDKMINSNCKEMIVISIDNYILYHNFFIAIKEKYYYDGKKLYFKLNALNFMNMHSTFLIDSLLKDVLSNNFFSSKINIRVFNEFYFKYLFLLYNDAFVSEVFLDFNNIYLWNVSQKFNIILRMNPSDKEKIANNYQRVKNKYNLPNNIKDDYWIKVALEKIDGKKHNKNIQEIIQWLKFYNKIEESMIAAYEDNCDFNHCGIGSMNYQQLIDIYNNENKMHEIYQPILSEFNYILYDIVKKYMEVFKEFKDVDLLNKIEHNLNIILK